MPSREITPVICLILESKLGMYKWSLDVLEFRDYHPII
jgi:hypothetical protein